MILRGASSPPAQGKSLALPRLVNTVMNAFARQFSLANNQKFAYILGEGSVVPITGGFPCWAYTEFASLGAYATARTRIPLPSAFTLLGYFGSASVNTVGGYRINVYDVNRRMRFTERPANFQNFAGTGNSPLVQGAAIGSRQVQPYQFQEEDAQALITVVNLENASNNIQFGFYGVQGGNPE